VRIVRQASRGGAKTLFLLSDSLGVDGSQASCSVQCYELPSHAFVLREFFPELAGGDEAGRAAFSKQPVKDGA
jgi:hypothetical protein